MQIFLCKRVKICVNEIEKHPFKLIDRFIKISRRNFWIFELLQHDLSMIINLRFFAFCIRWAPRWWLDKCHSSGRIILVFKVFDLNIDLSLQITPVRRGLFRPFLRFLRYASCNSYHWHRLFATDWCDFESRWLNLHTGFWAWSKEFVLWLL